MPIPVHFLFPIEPGSSRTVDEAFAREAEAVRALDLPVSLLDYEALVDDQDVDRAVRRIAPTATQNLLVYRGWMLSLAVYARLHATLRQRGYRPINSPTQYAHCHHLPESYPRIATVTPKTVWMEGAHHRPQDVMAALRVFGGKPVVVKDYVKSQKHFWSEACYIPDSADPRIVQRVVARFLELQGDVQGGLVFRQYVPLRALARHSKSGMPLSVEYRAFVVGARPILLVPYWEEGEYQAEPPPIEAFSQVLQTVESNFFSVDLAQRDDGSWLLVELGDGQVAGLPDRANATEFYSGLVAATGQLHA